MTEHTITKEELDALVAEHVMGCTVKVGANFLGVAGPYCGCPNGEHAYSGYDAEDVLDKPYLRSYSTNIADAWMVVEELRSRRIGADEMWRVFSWAHYYPAPLVASAICHAALTAVGMHPEKAPVPAVDPASGTRADSWSTPNES